MKAIAEFFVLFHKFDAISESNMFLKPSIAFPFLQSKTEVPKMAQKPFVIQPYTASVTSSHCFLLFFEVRHIDLCVAPGKVILFFSSYWHPLSLGTREALCYFLQGICSEVAVFLRMLLTSLFEITLLTFILESCISLWYLS